MPRNAGKKASIARASCRPTSLPGSFSGLHLLSVMNTAFRQIDATMDTRADFGAEYQAALEMQKT